MKALYILISISALLALLTGCPFNDKKNDNPNVKNNPNVTYDAAFTSDQFSGSKNCASCHDGLKDQNGTDVSINKAWDPGMMANASIDPFWRAKVASEVKRNPHVQGVIEDACARCHTPMAHVEAHFAAEPVALLGDGFLNPENPHYDQAMNGVSCTLCHQIEDDPSLGTPAGFSGGFVIADNLGSDRKAYGQYMEPDAHSMIQSVEFTPEYSHHTNESKSCATCHNLDTPVLDPDGTPTGETFPEQAPYTEWEYSDFNATQSCQSCHMPAVEGGVVISSRQQGQLPERSPFYEHVFLGANTYMLNIIKNNRVKLRALGDDTGYDHTIAHNREFLQAAAEVGFTGSPYYADGILCFSVKVTNHSGHKFPTSIPTRRAWLHITVKDDANNTVYESGALAPDGRQIIGVDDNTTQAYEPHYEKIVNASQVQVYEGIMGDTDGNVSHTLLNCAQFLKDNRLLPKGFKPNTPASAQPYGLAVNDTDFIGGSDTVEYDVPLAPSSSYTVTATLMYQTLSYGFAQDLYKDDDLPEVAQMKELDGQTDLYSEEVSADQLVINTAP